jgi:hypothetical protein
MRLGRGVEDVTTLTLCSQPPHSDGEGTMRFEVTSDKIKVKSERYLTAAPMSARCAIIGLNTHALG